MSNLYRVQSNAPGEMLGDWGLIALDWSNEVPFDFVWMFKSDAVCCAKSTST